MVEKGGTNLRATAWEFFQVVESLNTMDISVMIKHALTFVDLEPFVYLVPSTYFII
jgi:hypothetical protein